MEKWIEVMLNNSILMSVVILLILLLTKLFFKKHLAKWRYYTWIVIIVGLLVPYRPTFDIIPVQIDPPVQFAAQATIPVISERFESYDLQTNETEKPFEPVPPESNKITFNWSMVIVAIWAFGFFASLMHCFLKHRSFLNALHWFNPFVYMMARAIITDSQSNRLRSINGKLY